MAKSKIIIQLANNEISIDIALKRLLIICSDLDFNELTDWIECELNGYPADKPIPEYRNLGLGRLTYSGLKGTMINHLKLQHQPFPEIWIPEEMREPLFNVYEKDTIASVIKKANSENTLTIDRTAMAPFVKTGIAFTSITQNFDYMRFVEIVNKVGNILLKIFLKLDKKFGNLDELDLDTSKNTVGNVKEFENSLIIEIGELKVINIGDNNQINKSNIGDNNENLYRK